MIKILYLEPKDFEENDIVQSQGKETLYIVTRTGETLIHKHPFIETCNMINNEERRIEKDMIEKLKKGKRKVYRTIKNWED